MCKNLKCIVPNERSQSEKARCYVILTVTFLSRQARGDVKKLIGFQRSRGEGRITEKISGDLGGSETILSDPVMVDTCHCTFVKTTELITPRVNPSVHCGLQSIIYQYWLINCTNVLY